MKIIDLTHTFTADMPVFPGDPKATLEQVAHLEKDTFNDHKLSTVMHVGTHMDAPLHMLADGKTIDQLLLERCMGKGVVLDVRGKKQIDSSVLEGRVIDQGSVVLLYTGFGAQYRTDEYFINAPAITEDFAEKMVAYKINLLGMDMAGPDPDAPWPVHKILLGNDIYILENLANLESLLNVTSFEVIALPAKLQADAAPLRIIARIT